MASSSVEKLTMSKPKRSNPDSSQGPSSKKSKNEDFSFPPSTFEEELALLESMDPPPAPVHVPVDSHPPAAPSSSLQGGTQQRDKWARPPPPTIDPSTHPLIFQQIDIDHYVGSAMAGMPGAMSGPVPVLRMFGVTMEGNSVCAHIHGFHPYFYVPVPVGENGFLEEHCSAFRANLNRAVLDDMRSNKEGVQQAVLAVEICNNKCSMYGFYFNKKFPFLKITVALPRLVAATRRVLSTRLVPPYGSLEGQSYESNVEFEVRFMVDTSVVGCNWIECPPGECVCPPAW